MWKYPQDLTGMRFGRLTVIKRVEDEIDKKSGVHRQKYLCLCDCGQEKIVLRGNLISGSTISCGCYKKESALRLKGTRDKRKYNTYDLTGEYGIGYTEEGKEYYFDLEDYDKIKNFYWNVANDGYVSAAIIGSNKKIRMHRLIMDILNDSHKIVDHIISERKNDNRKCNLRITDLAKNAINKRMQSNNTSGVVGVSWSKSVKKWHATITLNKKLINLGYYKNKKEAINIRRQAEIKYFGEFRYKGEEYLARQNKTSFYEDSKSKICITIDPEGLEQNKLRMEDGYVQAEFGRYGMDYHVYEDQNDKLSYLMTELFYMNGEKREGIENMEQFKKIDAIIRSYDPTVLGIKISEEITPWMDEKSIPKNNESNFVRYFRPDTIKEYLFNKNICFTTDCY